MITTKETKFELPLSVVVYLFHIPIVILDIISLIETNRGTILYREVWGMVG